MNCDKGPTSTEIILAVTIVVMAVAAVCIFPSCTGLS